MSFEHKLRDQLRRDAASVPLPERSEPAVAVGRARARRRHRRAAATGLAVVAALAVAVPTVVAGGGSSSVSTGTPTASGLVPTGPLDLDWRHADGGLILTNSAFQDGEVVYALSTGPGVRPEDHPDGAYPRALYRLGEDGTWQSVALEGDRPRAADLSGAGGLLYAVSTGPGSGGGEGSAARFSTSADGGETWTTEDVPALDPPSTEVDWQPTTRTSVESTSSATLAVVSTSFAPDIESVFPEMAQPHGPDWSYAVETRDEGLVLVRYPVTEAGPGEVGAGGEQSPAVTAPPTTAPPAMAPEPGAEGGDEAEAQQVEEAADPAGTPEGSAGLTADEVEPEHVRTVPWSDLGVDGREALDTQHRLFTRSDDAWVPVDQVQGLAGVRGLNLDVAGDRFVASGWQGADAVTSVVLTSADGVSWSAVAGSLQGNVFGVGPALVEVPWEGTVLRVSGDAGATWSEIDLAEAAGLDAGSAILAADGGPLGLALAVGDAEDYSASRLVVSSDLVDWTSTPLDEVIGADGPWAITPIVGEDRIVVTASMPPVDGQLSASITAVGTPLR